LKTNAQGYVPNVAIKGTYGVNVTAPIRRTNQENLLFLMLQACIIITAFFNVTMLSHQFYCVKSSLE
jgi:hypothetical protein